MYSFLREGKESAGTPSLRCSLGPRLDRKHHVALVADLEVVPAALAVRPGADPGLVVRLAFAVDREDLVRGG